MEDIEKFFAEPYVKEGMRIKRSSVVFDFLADKHKKSGRACVILDRPVSRAEGDEISDFFCRQMENASDAVFSYDWDGHHSRVILSGEEGQVAEILKAYYNKMESVMLN